MNKYKPVGWRNESHRHYLAAKGVKTNRYMARAVRKNLGVKFDKPADEKSFRDELKGMDDVADREARKRGFSKGEGVYENVWGNAAVVRFEDGKLHAYDLDMAEKIPIGAVTKKFIRDVEDADPNPSDFEEDDDDKDIDSTGKDVYVDEFFAKKNEKKVSDDEKMMLDPWTASKKEWDAQTDNIIRIAENEAEKKQYPLGFKDDELDEMFLGKMSYSEAKKKWEKKNPGKDFDVDAIGVDVE